MPHVGYVDFVTNDGPGFHSNISSKSSLNPSLEPEFHSDISGKSYANRSPKSIERLGPLSRDGSSLSDT